MNKKVKKIIAREGLIILGIIFISSLFMFTPVFQYHPEYKTTRNYYAEWIEALPTIPPCNYPILGVYSQVLGGV